MRVADLKVGLLLYYAGSEHIYAVLVDEEKEDRVFSLAAWADVFPQMDQFKEAVGGGYPPRMRNRLFHEFSFGWGRRLLPPHADLQEYDVLVIVTTYELHGLPLHTVWVQEAGGFLGLSHAVTYCSSGTLFTSCVQGNAERLADLSKWAFNPATGWQRGAPPRPEVCCSYGTDIKTGQAEQYRALAGLFAQQFKRGKLLPMAPRYGLKARHMGWQAICVVCHGYYDLTNPEFSGLLLDRELGGLSMRPILLHRDQVHQFHDLPFQDVPIEVHLEEGRVPELMTVAELKVEFKTTAEFVALFGCSTGSGHVLSGDDFSSLAYQWLKLGTASVLASMWELDFGFISECMPLFLENWIKHRQPKAFALRQALRTMLERYPQIEPYDWGVLMLLGDWL